MGLVCVPLLVLGVLFGLIGHAVLVAPVRHRPRCCTTARFTTWFGAIGTAVVPVIGTGIGAGIGFLVGQLVWLGLGAEGD